MHLIDWKSNTRYLPHLATYFWLLRMKRSVDQVQIVGTKDSTGSLVKIAEASETRTIKLGKTWDEFLANASKALGYQVKSGHVMKKYSEFAHRSRSMGKQYCVSFRLSSRTFGIQKNHINEMDIVLCHPHTVTEHVLQEAKSRAQANRNQRSLVPLIGIFCAQRNILRPYMSQMTYRRCLEVVMVWLSQVIEGFKLKKSCFSTKEGQTVLAARNASLLSSYSGLFDYAVRHNVDATKSTSMGDANTGARLLSIIQPKPHPKSISEGDEIPNSKEPLSKSTKRRRISATTRAEHHPKKVRIGIKIKRYPNHFNSRSTLRVTPAACGSGRNGGLISILRLQEEWF